MKYTQATLLSLMLIASLYTPTTRPSSAFDRGAHIGFTVGVASTLGVFMLAHLLQNKMPKDIQHYTAKKMIKYFFKWLLYPAKHWNKESIVLYPAVTCTYRYI